MITSRYTGPWGELYSALGNTRNSEHLHAFQLFIHATKIIKSGHINNSVVKVIYMYCIIILILFAVLLSVHVVAFYY